MEPRKNNFLCKIEMHFLLKITDKISALSNQPNSIDTFDLCQPKEEIEQFKF